MAMDYNYIEYKENATNILLSWYEVAFLVHKIIFSCCSYTHLNPHLAIATCNLTKQLSISLKIHSESH